MAPDIIECCKR